MELLRFELEALESLPPEGPPTQQVGGRPHGDPWTAGIDDVEIDGQRCFAYRSVYFDTPELRCFWDHVHGPIPRFKIRTRLYRDTGNCVFEVKLKRNDEGVDKRQIEHPTDRREQLTVAATRCLDEALSGAGLLAPSDLAPSLHRAFRRITLVASESAERLTCDLDVRLSSPDGKAATLAGSVMILETKTGGRRVASTTRSPEWVWTRSRSASTASG